MPASGPCVVAAGVSDPVGAVAAGQGRAPAARRARTHRHDALRPPRPGAAAACCCCTARGVALQHGPWCWRAGSVGRVPGMPAGRRSTLSGRVAAASATLLADARAPRPACAALAMLSFLSSSSLAFGGNVAPRLSRSAVSMSAITPGDIGTTKPLGIWDPLDLIQNDKVKYRRWQEMEIKHGRFAMAACAHVFLTEVCAAATAPSLAVPPRVMKREVATAELFRTRPVHHRRASAGRATSRSPRTSNSPTCRVARSPRGPPSRASRGCRLSSSSRSSTTRSLPRTRPRCGAPSRPLRASHTRWPGFSCCDSRRSAAGYPTRSPPNARLRRRSPPARPRCACAGAG